MDYKKVYEEWLANPYFDEATKAELRAISEDEKSVSTQTWNLVQQGCGELLVPEQIV